MRFGAAPDAGALGEFGERPRAEVDPCTAIPPPVSLPVTRPLARPIALVHAPPVGDKPSVLAHPTCTSVDASQSCDFRGTRDDCTRS